MKTYVLLLEGGYYYIGKGKNINKRINSHRKGKGSTWTTLHKMDTVIEVLEGDVEKETTLRYMKKYGKHKVRGYAWTQIDGKNLPRWLK